MTSPDIPPVTTDSPAVPATSRPLVSTGAAIVFSALIVVLGIGFCSTRLMPGPFGHSDTNVSHDVVVSQLRAVAKLVSSEATVRDVVTYENTWYGSTKRSL